MVKQMYLQTTWKYNKLDLRIQICIFDRADHV